MRSTFPRHQITCLQVRRAEVIIDPALETVSGLSKICYASCKDILTRDQTLILRTVGVRLDAAMGQIETCLKAVLAIP